MNCPSCAEPLKNKYRCVACGWAHKKENPEKPGWQCRVCKSKDTININGEHYCSRHRREKFNTIRLPKEQADKHINNIQDILKNAKGPLAKDLQKAFNEVSE